MTDPIDALERSYDQLAKVVANLSPDQLALPTACPDWDVRALLNHTLGGGLMYALVNDGQVAGEDQGDVAGDDQHVHIAARPRFAAIAEEADPRQQVAMLAALITDTQERSAPVQRALRQAAAVDESAAATLSAQLERRRETIGRAVAMIPAGALRHPVEDSADTVAAVGSTEVYLLQRDGRGWDADRYQAWLSRTLIDALLVPDD